LFYRILLIVILFSLFKIIVKNEKLVFLAARY
jgi:hypothetical protein